MLETIFVIVAFAIGRQMGKFQAEQETEFRFEKWKQDKDKFD